MHKRQRLGKDRHGIDLSVDGHEPQRGFGEVTDIGDLVLGQRKGDLLDCELTDAVVGNRAQHVRSFTRWRGQ